MRILIVEDETRLAETLRQLMEDQRYQADTVGDGADGVDYGLTGQYDLIILDVMLPRWMALRWPGGCGVQTRWWC